MQFYPYQVCVRTAWPSIWTVFAKILSAFEQKSGVIWITGYRLDVLPSRSDGLQRLPKQCWLLKYTPCWILIDLASERCCSEVQTSSMFVYKTLRGVRTSSKACPNGCTGTGWFNLFFAMDSSCISSRSLWTVNVWIYEDSDLKTNCHVKTQPLHKVFLF
jgi:hypothetical protein